MRAVFSRFYEVIKMSKTATFVARMEPEKKKAVEDVYGRLGITLTDAFNAFVNKSIIENGLPFELKLPQYNERTLAGMKEAKAMAKAIIAGKQSGYDSVEALLGDLYAED